MQVFTVLRKKLTSGRIKYRDYLVSENIASAEELGAIQSQVKAEVDAAYEFAQNSPDPELSVAFEDVWVD